MKIEKGLGVSYEFHGKIFNAPKVIFSFPFLGLFPMISISLLIYNDSDCHQQPGDSGQVLVPYVRKQYVILLSSYGQLFPVAPVTLRNFRIN